jgi:N-acetylglucosamine-6-phosphate deacetylase
MDKKGVADEMTRRLVRSKRLFNGTSMLEDAELLIDDGTVQACGERLPGPAPDGVTDLGDMTILPGLVDLQVNGGGGIMFNNMPTSEGILAIRQAHCGFGTTSIVPTFVSGPTEDMIRAVDAVAEVNRYGPADAVPAVHLEGPYLALAKRGNHDPAFLRTVSRKERDLLLDLATRHPLITTVAPEVVGIRQIKEWVGGGAQVWLGHSDCDAETAIAAAGVGATSATHLFNAMSGLAARRPGLAGAAFADERLSAGLIGDGIHVSPITARAAHAAMGERLFLVSDCLAAAAGGPTRFRLADRPMEVSEGACRTPDGALAGAAMTLLQCVAAAVRLGAMSFEAAVRAATVIPARLIGQDRIGRLVPGSCANFIAVDDGIRLTAVYADGRWCRRP